MSPRRTSEGLIAELAGTLAPVRPLPALRWQLAAVAGAWLATAACVAVAAGLHPSFAFRRGPASAGVAFALAALGAGGLVAALAARVPGRERVATGGAAGVGLALAVLAAVLVGLLTEAAPSATALHGSCAAAAVALALPCGVVAGMLARRGAAWRFGATGLALACGAAGTGALLVHLSCPLADGWHWLLEHAGIPLGAGLALGAALARALRRRRPGPA